jgi:AAA domain
MRLEDILSRFDGIRKCRDGYKARCPAHDDRQPSLSITEKNGKILINCFAQCALEKILAKVNLQLSDLFINEVRARRQSTAAREVGRYPYTDEQGNLLFEKVRLEPKGFTQRKPDGNGGWIYNLGNVRRVLYRLPEVLAARHVLLVEGEKDADRGTSMGFTTTTSGAVGSWKPEFAEVLRGKHVAIIPDADHPGRTFAHEIAASCYLIAASVKVVELVSGIKDLSEWPFSAEALGDLIQKTPLWTENKKEMNWRELFHTYEEFEAAPELTFAIEGFLQNDGATLIGGLSGHGKSLIMLSMIKAQFAGAGTRLWGQFLVKEPAERILYLIPESALTPFKYRLKLFDLYKYVAPDDDRLLVRTLTKGLTPSLSDPRILAAAKGAYVYLDTAVRFSTEGDENSAADNQNGLATDLFSLLGAGAKAVIGAHHSPKSFTHEKAMGLENVLRGSGDIGAMLTTAWGIKQLDAAQNIIHVQNIKARDFEAVGAFQIIGRPFISERHDFKLLKAPDDCGSLHEELEEQKETLQDINDKRQKERTGRIAMVRAWLSADPNLSADELRKKFNTTGLDVAIDTVYRYQKEVKKESE